MNNITAPTMASTSSTTMPSDMNFYSQVGSSFAISLIGVIAMILLLAWLVKRINWKKRGGQLMEVKATFNISPKERVVLIYVDHKLLVVGITPHQMTLLHTINEQRTEMLLAKPPETNESAKDSLFHQLLQSALKSKKE